MSVYIYIDRGWTRIFLGVISTYMHVLDTSLTPTNIFLSSCAIDFSNIFCHRVPS